MGIVNSFARSILLALGLGCVVVAFVTNTPGGPAVILIGMACTGYAIGMMTGD